MTERKTAALLLADMEGSTRLLRRLGDRYAEVLADYRWELRQAVIAAGGEVADTEGDGLFAVFSTADSAVVAAVESQRALARRAWPDGATVRARIGIHVGDIRTAVTGYVGLAIHVAARVSGAAHGGQILATANVAALAAGGLPPGVTLGDLGEHRLKDIEHPERLFQVNVEGLPGDFPAPRGISSRRHNLPAPLSSFVGRDTEVADVDDLLDRHRLVTLTGGGGAGKTRLALHVAAARLDTYQDGVWLADLSSLSDPDQVAAVVGRALGMTEARSGDLVDQLVRRLESARLLLLVDNCEHMLGAASQLVEQVIRAAPGVTVLATTREPLGVRGETKYRVPSLALPPRSASAEVVRSAPAVRLLVERVAAARPGLVIDDDAIEALAEVGRRLDGIPLALELAAARTRVLAPRQLLDRLDGAFTVLGSGDRSAPTRQRTLRATLDWSYGLLTEPEQVLLRRLGVFAGGFTLDAAEAVCGGEPLGPEDLLDGLDHLVASSLVAAAEWTDPRYAMLRTVRSYARERLVEAGEADLVAPVHAAYFRSMVSSGGHGLGQREQAQWLAGLEPDHDNLRSALRWSIDGNDARGAADLAGHLVHFWYRRGYFGEARSWIDEVLGMPGHEASTGLANVLRFAAATAMDAGEGERARAMADRAAEVARNLGDRALLARSLNVRAGIAWRVGELAAARTHYDEAIALMEDEPDRFLVNLLVNKAQLLLDMVLLDEAADAVAQLRRVDSSNENVDLHLVEGALHLARGELPEAEENVAAAIAAYRELGLLPNLANALRVRAEVARAADRHDDARRFGAEAAEMFGDIDDPSNVASVQIILAGVAIDTGGFDEARSSLDSSVIALYRAGWRLGVYDGLVEYSRLAAAVGAWQRHARLLGAAQTLAASFPATYPWLSGFESAAIEKIGEDGYRTAFEAGASMPLDAVVDYAVGN